MLKRVTTPDAHPTRRFVPNVEALEDRVLPSFVIPHRPPTPLRTSGLALQVGSEVIVVVERLGVNDVHVDLDGRGGLTVEWDGNPTHSFKGVKNVVVIPTGLVANTVSVTAPSKDVAGEVLVLDGHDNTTVTPGSHLRTSPEALQVGSDLFVLADKPSTDTVNLKLDASGDAKVSVNGKHGESFEGVKHVFIVPEGLQSDTVNVDVPSQLVANEILIFEITSKTTINAPG